MKNTFKYLALLLFVSVFSSCDKDDSSDEINDKLSGSYEININGELYDKASNISIPVALKDDKGNWLNLLAFGRKTEDNTEIAVTINQFPKEIGKTVVIDYDGDPGILISSGSDLYITRSGSLKRETATRISFTGKVSKGILNDGLLSISGFVESEDLKKLK